MYVGRYLFETNEPQGGTDSSFPIEGETAYPICFPVRDAGKGAPGWCLAFAFYFFFAGRWWCIKPGYKWDGASVTTKKREMMPC